MINTTRIWKVKWNDKIIYVRGQREADGTERIAAFQPDNKANNGIGVYSSTYYTSAALSQLVGKTIIYIDDNSISDVEQTLLRDKYYNDMRKSCRSVISIDYFFWY